MDTVSDEIMRVAANVSALLDKLKNTKYYARVRAAHLLLEDLAEDAAEVEGALVPIFLRQVGRQKILVIKLVRELTGKSLTDSKALCDGADDNLVGFRAERQLITRLPYEKAKIVRDRFHEFHGCVVELADPLTLLAMQAER